MGKSGNLRYNRTFKKGILICLFCVLLAGCALSYSIVATVQYYNIIPNMLPAKATVVDYDWVHHKRGPGEQEMYITYTVNGKVFERELETDTPVSFSAGRGAFYSVGDSIDILYDPENPAVIAVPRSMKVGYFWLAGSSLFFLFFCFLLIHMIKNAKTFLVTQDEYEKEGAEIKRVKAKAKAKKKQKRLARKEKHKKAGKVIKIVLIVFGAAVGLFLLFLLFGTLLRSLGYGN